MKKKEKEIQQLEDRFPYIYTSFFLPRYTKHKTLKPGNYKPYRTKWKYLQYLGNPHYKYTS
jgi:hypothetical protein